MHSQHLVKYADSTLEVSKEMKDNVLFELFPYKINSFVEEVTGTVQRNSQYIQHAHCVCHHGNECTVLAKKEPCVVNY